MQALGVDIPVFNDGFILLATGDFLDPVAGLFCPLGHTPATEGRPVQPGDIAAECVALSLAGVHRFGGQTLPTKHGIGLSDAQHAYHVAEVLAHLELPTAMIWQGLHHDDGESFGLGSDIPAPSKRKYPELFAPIRAAQQRLCTAICRSLRVHSWHEDMWHLGAEVWTEHPQVKEADQAAYALETCFMPRSNRWPSRRGFGSLAATIETRGLLSDIDAAAAWLSVHTACSETVKRHGIEAPLKWPGHSEYIAARRSILALAAL